MSRAACACSEISTPPDWADFVEEVAGFGACLRAAALVFLDAGDPRASRPCGCRHRLELGQFPEVLGDCCEGEFILDATGAS